MNLNNLCRRSSKALADNSPVILTAFGVAGVLATAYLTGKAAINSTFVMDREQARKEDGIFVHEQILSTKEKALLVWKLYIPAAGVAATTITCIILSNRISTRRAAALATVLTISERAFDEYRSKVVEKIGATKETALRDELATERLHRNQDAGFVVLGEGDQICYDVFSDRVFASTMEKLRKAENDVNYQLNHEGWCSLGEYYRLIGIPATPYSEEVGWNSDKLLEVSYTATLTKDDKPAIAVNFHVAPTRGFDSFH